MDHPTLVATAISTLCAFCLAICAALNVWYQFRNALDARSPDLHFPDSEWQRTVERFPEDDSEEFCLDAVEIGKLENLGRGVANDIRFFLLVSRYKAPMVTFWNENNPYRLGPGTQAEIALVIELQWPHALPRRTKTFDSRLQPVVLWLQIEYSDSHAYKYVTTYKLAVTESHVRMNPKGNVATRTHVISCYRRRAPGAWGRFASRLKPQNLIRLENRLEEGVRDSTPA